MKKDVVMIKKVKINLVRQSQRVLKIVFSQRVYSSITERPWYTDWKVIDDWDNRSKNKTQHRAFAIFYNRMGKCKSLSCWYNEYVSWFTMVMELHFSIMVMTIQVLQQQLG